MTKHKKKKLRTEKERHKQGESATKRAEKRGKTHKKGNGKNQGGILN